MKHILLALALVAVCAWDGAARAQPAPPPAKTPAGPAIPCRIRDGENPDLMVMTLGYDAPVVSSAEAFAPLAQGLFYPDDDRVVLRDGRTIEHYYRDTLGVRHYRPIDKSVFPLPPSGWCSWYYYFYEISGDEVRRNARWIADNLRDYGLQYVQLDDGWQGVGRGFGSNRDWTTINDRFGDMQKLAADIKKLGLRPGLWIAPHGQSNPKVVRANPGAFLLKPDGTTLSDTWEGAYLVDPSTPAGHAYLGRLMSTLCGWGYEYFKIDGQPCVVEEYRRLAGQVQRPTTDPEGLYRDTLRTIRGAIGPKRYLLGCWETPREGIGLTDGWRTGADVVPGWGGFRIAVEATMGYYFLHNVVMYCDPDTVMVRPPLSLEQARMWATLQGLTGQALMCSDRMMDLSDERVELYRRIYPAADIRPLDLFPSDRTKHVWDLKVNHVGRRYDVVGLLNLDETRSRPFYLNWKQLGITTDGPMHVYDFWNKEYLGAFRKGFSTEVGPTSCKVLTLMPAVPDIQLLSTSRHITQGWPDLTGTRRRYGGRADFQGTSRVIKGDPYRLTFVFPVGLNFTVSRATAGDRSAKIANHNGWATVEFLPDRTGEIEWTVAFEPVPYYRFPSQNPGNLRVSLEGLDRATVKWDPPGTSTVGSYWVALDGTGLGGTQGNSFPLPKLSFGRSHKIEVVSAPMPGFQWGTSGELPPKVEFTPDALVRDEYALGELEPVRPSPDSRLEKIGVNRSLAGGLLVLGGKQYAAGVGAKAGTAIEYNLHGLFGEFSALVGVAQGGNADKVVFIVEGDGRELWRSGEVRKDSPPQPVRVSVTGVRALVLRTVSAAGGKPGGAAVNWCDGRVMRK